MNKKIAIVASIAIVAIAMVVVLKTTVGDKIIGLPGEENTENALHLQESNQSTAKSTSTVASGESSSAESSESGP